MDTLDTAIDLATSIVKSACLIWTGPFSAIPNSIADLVNARVKGKLQQRRAERFFDNCVDTVAEKLLDLIQRSGKPLDITDLNAAIYAVRDTFELAQVKPASLMKADLDARTLEKNMGPARSKILRQALLSESGQHFYDLVLRESCSYAIEFISTLPSHGAAAFAEILKRETLIISSLQEVLARLPDRESVDDFAADYRRLVIQRLDRMQVFGAKLQSDYGRRYPLSVAYIGLAATSHQKYTTMSPSMRSSSRVTSSDLSPRITEPFSNLSSWLIDSTYAPQTRHKPQFPWDDPQFPWDDPQFRTASAYSGYSAEHSSQLWRDIGEYLRESSPGEDSIEPRLLKAKPIFPTGAEDKRQGYSRTASPTVPDHGSMVGEVSIEHWLTKDSRILLVGEAGSGKSTLLQWLAVRVARADFEGELKRWNTYIPFFIPLRRYAAEGLPSPESFPMSVGKNIISSMPKGWVQSHLRDGRALVLIDGLDELKEGSPRTEALEWLQDLIDTFPGCGYIITSRPGALEDGFHLPAGFTSLELRPMTPGKIRSFVEHWHDAMRVELADNDEHERLSADQASLLATLETDRHVRALCVNPLLCALVCALNRERHGHLPKDRMGVYSGALEMLLDARDRERGIRSSLEISREAKITLLQDLALYLVRNALSDAAVDRVREQIARSSRTLNEITAEPDKVLKFLLERSGLIRSPSEGRIDFIHRSFQEYLAGKAAVESDEIGYLLQHATDDQFRDVIVMAVGHAQPRQAEEFLTAIIMKSKSIDPKAPTDDEATALAVETGNEGEITASRTPLPRLRLLAIACLQTVRRIDPDLRKEIEDLAQDLLPPESVDIAQTLAGIGPIILDLMAERPASTPSQAAASIRVASLLGERDAMLFIAGLASQFDGIEDEIVRSWPEFDFDEYSTTVIPRMNWSGYITITDAALLPYVVKMDGLKELTIASPVILQKELPPLPAEAHFLIRLIYNPLKSLETLQRWHDLRYLEFHLRSLSNVKLSGLKRFRKLTGLRVISEHAGMIDLEPLARLSNLRVIQLVTPHAKEIRVHAFSNFKDLTIYVPPDVVISGRNLLLKSGCKFVVTKSFPDLVQT